MTAAAPPPDRPILQLLAELKAAAPGFPWESALWPAAARQRRPYRALLLFGLSPRTKDARLSAMCRRLFQLFPNAPALAQRQHDAAQAARNIIRPAQAPFLTSAANALTHGVPRRRDALLQIKGVGDKIAECVLAYGWGDPALPLDVHGLRVLNRVFGATPTPQATPTPHKTPAPGVTPTPAQWREILKSLHHRRAEQFANAEIAMIDIHEILRLHGQQTCARQPACHRCPVSQCQSRRQPQTQPPAPPTPTLWNEWRALLQDPAPT